MKALELKIGVQKKLNFFGVFLHENKIQRKVN